MQREIRPGVVVNLEQPEDYDSEAVKAQALANAQSAFMKHEETVRSHSSYKQQRDGGDRLPDVIIDVDGTFSLAATSVCWFGQREWSRRRRLHRPSGLVYMRLFVCSANHLPSHCCQLQDVAPHQMFCIVHLPNPNPLSSHYQTCYCCNTK